MCYLRSGTIGPEILKELPETDEILIPIGGGGLISRIALAIKTMKPSSQNNRSCSCRSNGNENLPGRAGFRLASLKTVAEGVAVKQPGDLTFAITRKYGAGRYNHRY